MTSSVPQHDDDDSSDSDRAVTMSRRKRKAQAAKEEEECEDRDHWEECSGCQQWVNRGKGRGALQGGCGQCGGVVAWQGHQELQSWIQCDACGRWRTVPDSLLRYAHICSTVTSIA